MQIAEKTSNFYLGRTMDGSNSKNKMTPFYYDSKNFTTHAVCVGMTGSGKTGLGISLLEEAGLDKIPCLIIDPKGDLGDLLLTFPHLSANEFLPWIDREEASRCEMSPEAYAEKIATTWKEGLNNWGESAERIQNLRDSVNMVIYTPASNAGVPISVLSSFSAPSQEIVQDPEALRDRLLSTTASLLGLLGINADPIKGREHILISTLISMAWSKGQDIDIATLIQQVQKPPFTKIGALDADTFFPPKERMELSITLNNLLASPSFQAWMEGEPLDIHNLLYTAEGKPKLSILSIAHLSANERMFFVTIFLNELLSWMRRQPGTSSLRALLYMDEVFGFFPPTSMPPSKLPMLTLLKQARAFGLGIVLATQNPVDLDYKGLSNCGTWFIGKLQTERDKARVLEGLQAASNGEFDSKTLDEMLATTKNRVFIMRSIYETKPIQFETRWTMSYLRGPLTLSQISQLTDKTPLKFTRQDHSTQSIEANHSKPLVPTNIQEYFGKNKSNKILTYKPLVMGIARLHFVEAKNKIDAWRDLTLAAPVDDSGEISWNDSIVIGDLKNDLDKTPITADCNYMDPPPAMLKEKNYPSYEKNFATYLYQTQTLTLFHAAELNSLSQPNESKEDFLNHLSLKTHEKNESEIKKIQDKYAVKKALLSEKVRKAEEKLNAKQQQAFWQKADTFISFLTSMIGAFFGKGVTKGTINTAGTTMRRASKIGQGSQAAQQAEDDFNSTSQQLEELQNQLDAEITQMTNKTDPSSIQVETIEIHPRKSDISVEKMAILWNPLEQ